MFYKFLGVGLIVLIILAMGSGCTSHLHPAANPDKAMPTQTELKKLSGKRFHVPVRIIVNASDDMVGKVGGDLMHYPLRKVIEDCFNNITYKVFDQPHGEVIDAFEMKIEPQVSILSSSWGTATYKLVLYISFYEPGEKRLESFCLDKTTTSPVGEDDQIPDAVYNTVKNIAVETMSKLVKAKRVRRAITRFEDR
jgi:hypothetical protein